MVGTADERSRFDMAEAEREAVRFQGSEFVGVVEACDGKMLFGRLEVLADGHDVAVD